MNNNTTKIIRLITFLLMFFYVSIGNTKNMTIYDFSFEDIDGNQVNLDKFKGKPIFMVNTAVFTINIGLPLNLSRFT